MVAGLALKVNARSCSCFRLIEFREQAHFQSYRSIFFFKYSGKFLNLRNPALLSELCFFVVPGRFFQSNLLPMKRMLRFLPVILLLTGIIPNVYSQKFEWAKLQSINYGLNVQMVRYTVATDPAGNVLQVGLLNYKANTTPGMSGDVMLRKYDRNGNPVFQQTLTGNAVIRNIATYLNGDFLLVGAFRDSVRFSPTQKITGTSTSQYFIAKFSQSGQFLWHRNISATVTGMNGVTAVALDSAGMLYLAFSGTNLNSFIRKFDAAGTELLTIHQNRVRNISSLAVDAAGNILAAGSCIETNATFGGQSFSNGTSLYNFYVVKYRPSGTPRWVKLVQDITCVYPEVKAGPAGSVYLAGPLNGSFTFGTFTTQGRTWSYDFFLTKLDSAGTFQWVREVPQATAADARNGYSNYLEVDAAGNAYLAGFMRNTLNWGNGIQNTGYGSTDLLVQKYDPAGTLLWSKVGGGPGIDEGHSVAVNHFGEVYLTGISRGPVTLDTMVHTFSTSQIYTVLTKVSAPGAVSGISESKNALALKLYPNPAKDQVELVLPKQVNKPIQVKLINVAGQLVQQINLGGSNSKSYLFRLKALPAGLYFVEVRQEDAVFRQRLVLH